MFFSVSALAYVTFNRRFKLIRLLNGTILDAQLFAKTYILSYFLNVVAGYTVIILIFTFSINPGIEEYNWYYVMYPQCGWLLFAKLYLNEVSQIINLLKQKRKNLRNMEIFESGTNVMDLQIVKHVSRLFLFQFTIWLAGVYAAGFYIYLIVIQQPVEKWSTVFGWQLIWYWQLLIAFCVAILYPFVIRSSLIQTS